MGRRRFDRPVLWSRALTAAVILAAAAYVVYVTRHQWFFYDDWDFLNEASGSLPFQPFLPHNGHPSLIPKLVYWVLYHAVGLRHYWPYMAALLLLHATLAELTRRVLMRSGVAPPVALAAAVLVLFLGAGWENIIWAFQVGFIGGLVCGLAALLVLDSGAPSWRRDLAASVLLVLGLQFSSTGLVMLVVVAVRCLLAGELRRLARICVLPAALYLAWYYAERNAGAHANLSGAALREIPHVVWFFLQGSYETLTRWALLGVVLAVLLLALLARAVVRRPSSQLTTAAMAVGAMFFLALVALQRTSTGVETALSSRYVYVVVVLTAPLLVAGLVDVLRLRPQLVTAGVGLAVLAIAGYQLTVLDDFAAGWGTLKQMSRTRVLATAILLQHGDSPLADRPDPQFMPQLTVDDVARFQSENALPSQAGVAAADVLNARLYLDTLLSDVRRPIAGATAPTVVTAAATSVVAGCVSSTGTTGSVRLRLGAPAVVHLSATGGAVTVQLVMRDAADTATPPRTVSLPPGGEWLAIDVAGVDAIVSAPAGTATVCGVNAA